MPQRGPGFHRPPAYPNIPPALQRAHEFMELGNYAEAAAAFEKLALEAKNQLEPRAPFFYLQAGCARIHLRQVASGMTHLRHGLELFAASGHYHQLYRAGTRIVHELKARGLEKESQEISRLVHRHIPAISESPTQRGPEPGRRTPLATHCDFCGGPIHSDEMEWADATTATCPFCNSPVHLEE